jgi:hypothetical protein
MTFSRLHTIIIQKTEFFIDFLGFLSDTDDLGASKFTGFSPTTVKPSAAVTSTGFTAPDTEFMEW